jgi:hypothetical protein
VFNNLAGDFGDFEGVGRNFESSSFLWYLNGFLLVINNSDARVYFVGLKPNPWEKEFASRLLDFAGKAFLAQNALLTWQLNFLAFSHPMVLLTCK